LRVKDIDLPLKDASRFAAVATSTWFRPFQAFNASPLLSRFGPIAPQIRADTLITAPRIRLFNVDVDRLAPFITEEKEPIAFSSEYCRHAQGHSTKLIQARSKTN
jgi:hypothetical protein